MYIEILLDLRMHLLRKWPLLWRRLLAGVSLESARRPTRRACPGRRVRLAVL